MKELKYSLIAATLAAGCLQITTASAVDIRLSGFLNAIGNVHDADQMRYLDAVDDTWGFTNTSFGLNAASKIDKNLSVAAQLFGSGNGDNVFIDWAFATYKLDDSSVIKFGKIKYAGNLYSETVDVGFIFPWVRAPESIYSEAGGLFFEAYEGAAYKFTGGDDIELGFEFYYGATDEEEEEGGIEGRDQMFGLVLSAENDIGKVMLSYNDSVITSIDTSGATPVEGGENGLHSTIISVGAEANLDNLQILAEVSQSELENEPDEDRQGWYVTLAYSIGEWKPHFTIQEYAVDDASVEQSSMTLGINKRLGTNAVLKLEAQKVDDIIGNGFFEDALLDTTDLADGSSVNMFNIALNIVF